MPKNNFLNSRLNKNQEVEPTDGRFSECGTLVVKVTSRCNLRCGYCYEKLTRYGDMDISVFRKLVVKVLSETNRKKISFVFHGGEPTLLPISWYREATNYTRMVAKQKNKLVRFSIQTNLISLTMIKINELKQLKIDISGSIDGPIDTHDMRKGSNRATEVFHQALSVGVNPGILMTINNSNYDKFDIICLWLNRELGIKNFKANIIYPVGSGALLPTLTTEQILKAHHAILQHMIENKGLGLIEDNIATELLKMFCANNPKLDIHSELCRQRVCGAGSKVLGISPTGNILPCGRFEWDDKQFSLGSLVGEEDASLKSRDNISVDEFHEYHSENWIDCKSCDARNICSFGCQAFILRSNKKINIECFATKMRYHFYKENESSLKLVAENIASRYISSNNGFSDDGYSDKYSDKYSDQYHDNFNIRSKGIILIKNI